MATADSPTKYREHRVMLGSPNSCEGPQNHNENGTRGPQNVMTTVGNYGSNRAARSFQSAAE